MTIPELAEVYRDSATLLWGRIKELEQQQRDADSEQERLNLDSRIRILRSMYRDTRAVTRELESYCRWRERSAQRHEENCV